VYVALLRAAHLRFNSLAIGFLRNAEKAMRLLLAPNSFKECAQSCVVAELMRRECAKRGIDARVLPLSDGGDGFVRACAAVLPLQLTSQTIRRCYDDKATAAEFAWDPISRTRYLESANIIGLKKRAADGARSASLKHRKSWEIASRLQTHVSCGDRCWRYSDQ